jgi:hypothetical protein
VETGKNTSTVIPASRKRRRKGNLVVSDETVIYGYESSSTLTADRLHYKLQTRPLVREGAPRRRTKKFSDNRKEKVKSVHGPKGVPDTKIYWLTDWLTVSRKVTSSVKPGTSKPHSLHLNNENMAFYSKTCEVGQPYKSATCSKKSRFYWREKKNINLIKIL